MESTTFSDRDLADIRIRINPAIQIGISDRLVEILLLVEFCRL